MLKARVGDKVRCNASGKSARGVILSVEHHVLLVQLDGVVEPIRVPENDLTNLSLAARRAWKSMPKRAVGRKPGVKIRDRVSVTLRIDRDLWEQFQELEKSGKVSGRTDVINTVLRKVIKSISDSTPKLK